MMKLLTIITACIFINGLAHAEYISMSKYTQKQRNWCWAAVSQTVRKNNKDVFRYQCKMASALLTNNSDTYCCGTDTRWEKNLYDSNTHPNRKSQCDKPYSISKALEWNGIYQKTYRSPGSSSSIRDQIGYNDPVVVRVAWNSGGGHAMVIYGVTVGGIAGTTYNLWNPGRSSGAETIYHSSLRQYRGSGSWSHTYFTN